MPLPLNPATQAINAGNLAISMMQSLQEAVNSAVRLTAINSATPLGNAWNVLNTGAFSSDGSTSGWTADQTPNTSHPIDPTKYPSLTVSLSALQLEQILGIAASIIGIGEGNAVSANGLIPALLDAVNDNKG